MTDGLAVRSGIPGSPVLDGIPRWPVLAVVTIIVALFCSALAFDFGYYFLLIGVALLVLVIALYNITWAMLVIPVALMNPVGLRETGTNLIISEIVLLVIFSVALIRLCLLAERLDYPRRFLLPAVLITASALVSIAVATYPIAAVKMTVRYVEVLVVLFLVVVNYFRTLPQLRAMVAMIIVGGCIASCIGIVQFFAEASAGLGTARVFGLLGGGYGAVVASTILFSFGILLYERAWFSKMLALFAVLLGSVALILNQTRTWIVAVVAVLCYMMFVVNSRNRGRIFLVFGSVLALIVIMISTDVFGLMEHNSFGLAILAAFRFGRKVGQYSMEDFSLFLRMNVWLIGAKLFLQHPVFGIGAGNLRFSDYLNGRLGPPADTSGFVDNQYLNFFAEMGLLAGIIWIIYLVRAAGVMSRNTRRSLPETKAISFGFHGTLLIFIIGSVSWVVTAEHEVFAFLVLIIGLAVSLERLLTAPDGVPGVRLNDHRADAGGGYRV